LREGELYAEFWLEVIGERDHLEALGVDGNIILKWIFKE
jgi:hypothetical protein